MLLKGAASRVKISRSRTSKTPTPLFSQINSRELEWKATPLSIQYMKRSDVLLDDVKLNGKALAKYTSCGAMSIKIC
jgi:hypothetical protein